MAPRFSLIAAALIALACAGCRPAAEPDLQARRELFQQLKPNLAKKTSERVQVMPPALMKDIRRFDQEIGIRNTQSYAARAATPQESALIASYLELLPAAERAVFDKKLLAIYLVDNFGGAGMTDWVVDDKGGFFYYFTFNSALLEKSLDQWLTERENSPFENNPALPAIKVKTGTAYKALMYGLLHEGAHILDYENGVTPAVDPLHSKVASRNGATTPFVEGAWRSQNLPAAEFDFTPRDKLNFYGMYEARPLVPKARMPAMFARLRQTPFGGFYGSTSWNEHFADQFTYQYLESRLGGAISMELTGVGGTIDSYMPTKVPSARQKSIALQAFHN